MGIKDYANLLFADSAVVNVLLSNASISADELLKGSAIASSEKEPTDAALNSALSKHFQNIVYRTPHESELANYVRLFRKSATEAGNTEAMRLVLMAVMLHYESVYRVEIGLGAKGTFGPPPVIRNRDGVCARLRAD